MPFQASCTCCNATFKLADAMLGKKVRCPQCKQVFQLPSAPVGQPDEPEPDDIPEVPLAAPREEEGRLQHSPSERRPRSEERRRPRRAEDSEDRDDRPRKGSSAALPLILGAVGAGVLLIGGIVLVAILANRTPANERVQVVPEKQARNDVFKGAENNPVGKQLPPIPPPDNPPDLPRPPEQPVVVNHDPIEVPPALALDPIRVVDLKGERAERLLPGTLADVCVGGGGRFLILNLPAQRKLAIFDANEGKVVKYLPTGAEDVKIAAGLDRLVMVPTRGVGDIQRWSLATFEQELAVPLEGAGPVKAICMGSASHGPLVICTQPDQFGQKARFFSLATLKPVDVTIDTEAGRGRASLQGHFLNASADGRVFACRDGVGGEPHTILALVLNGRQGTLYARDAHGSMFLPDPDGRFLYAESGIYTPELKLIYPDKEISQIVNPFLPAQQGNFFLRIEGEDDRPRPGRPSSATGKLSIYLAGSTEPFTALAGIEGYIGGPIAYGSAPDKLMHEKRIHLIPDAKLLVTIPRTNDRLILRTVDLDKELAASAADYLFVASRAPDTATPGAAYRYQARVKSKKGGVKYTLEAAPVGMTVSTAGLVVWNVPATFADKRVDAILKATDADGKEAFQNLRLTLGAK